MCRDDLGVWATYLKLENDKGHKIKRRLQNWTPLPRGVACPLFLAGTGRALLVLPRVHCAISFEPSPDIFRNILYTSLDDFELDLEALSCLIIMKWGQPEYILFALFCPLIIYNSLDFYSLRLGMLQHHLDGSFLCFWILGLIIW